MAEQNAGLNQTTEGSSRIYFWIGMLLVLIMVAGLYYYFSAKSAQNKKAEHKGPRAVPIEVATSQKGDIPVYVRALGSVVPIHSVTIVSQVQGRIVSVNFQEGQFVKKDQPLVKIDPRPFEAAVMEAEGQLARDKSLSKQAQINLQRYKEAYAARAISQQQLSDQQQLVQQTAATVTADQGVLANAKVNLEYTDITSPLDGQVGLRLIDPGNMVQANGSSQLAVITQIEPITVIFSVAEDNLSQIRSQLRDGITMPVDAYDRTQKNKLATGKFLALDNQIDPATGTVRIRAVFENKDHSLFPNQFINTRLRIDNKENVVLIPTAALQVGPQGTYVYVISKDNIAKIQTVKMDITEGDRVSVQGLDAGQTIAISGFDKLQDGITVRIRNNREEPTHRGTPITRN